MSKYPALVNTARGGYLGGASEYARLKNARQINNVCALESCSWGAYQIMGFHWKSLGYANIHAFVDAMQCCEGQQLDVFVQFITADTKLHTALKAKKWADFARIYNGPAYKENFYDQKLAHAYANAQENLA
jgi:16S rRNA G966 N2-methylase RsmD